MTIRDTIQQQGYAIVEDLFDAEMIQTIVDDYHNLLNDLAPKLYADGRLSSDYSNLPFNQRLTAILNESKENLYRHFDIALPNEGVTLETPFHLSPVIFDMLRHPKLLDYVESVIGGEILASPIQHVRIKPPQNLVSEHPNTLVQNTAWHQDQGVVRPDADESEILTVWIAITDATLENGCLQVVPYSHLGGITQHCTYDTLTIPTQLLSGEPKPLPVKSGSAIFMHSLTQHASLPNVSDTIRWSFDLRYQLIDKPTGREEMPSLIVRSRNSPERVQTDYDAWYAQWLEARQQIASLAENRPKKHRWDGDAEVCA